MKVHVHNNDEVDASTPGHRRPSSTIYSIFPCEPASKEV